MPAMAHLQLASQLHEEGNYVAALEQLGYAFSKGSDFTDKVRHLTESSDVIIVGTLRTFPWSWALPGTGGGPGTSPHLEYEFAVMESVVERELLGNGELQVGSKVALKITRSLGPVRPLDLRHDDDVLLESEDSPDNDVFIELEVGAEVRSDPLAILFLIRDSNGVFRPAEDSHFYLPLHSTLEGIVQSRIASSNNHTANRVAGGF